MCDGPVRLHPDDIAYMARLIATTDFGAHRARDDDPEEQP